MFRLKQKLHREFVEAYLILLPVNARQILQAKQMRGIY